MNIAKSKVVIANNKSACDSLPVQSNLCKKVAVAEGYDWISAGDMKNLLY